jgi:hypothetical protein
LEQLNFHATLTPHIEAEWMIEAHYSLYKQLSLFSVDHGDFGEWCLEFKADGLVRALADMTEITTRTSYHVFPDRSHY